MALTSDEMIKFAKAIFYASGMNINGRYTIDKALVFEILNDYSPDCKVELAKTEDSFELRWKIKTKIVEIRNKD